MSLDINDKNYAMISSSGLPKDDLSFVNGIIVVSGDNKNDMTIIIQILNRAVFLLPATVIIILGKTRVNGSSDNCLGELGPSGPCEREKKRTHTRY